MSTWQIVLLEPAKMILDQIGQFVINILLVLVILVIGWLLAKMIKSIVTKLLRALKLDELSDRIELESLLAKGGIKYSLSELLGVVVYWLAILVTFMVAVNSVGLTVAADLLNRVVLYIPNIIAAIFILILGMFVATLLKNIIQTIATNAGLAEEKLLGKIVEMLVMVFVIVMALEQLNIGAKTLQLILSIVLGALGLGVALAFGLGCKEIAGKIVAEFLDKIKKK
jgi:small-conductance mechanosensitive channel